MHKNTNFINLTPHDITILVNGEKRIFPASGQVLRLAEIRGEPRWVDGVPIVKKEFRIGGHLPPEQDDTLYIVSLVVKQAYPNRTDFICADDLIRNERGEIVAARGFFQ